MEECARERESERTGERKKMKERGGERKMQKEFDKGTKRKSIVRENSEYKIYLKDSRSLL